MADVCAMSPVHEQVHQRAGEQQQKWQRAKQVGTVFGEQEKCGYRQKCNGNPFISPWCRMCIVFGMTVMFHHALLSEKIRASRASRALGCIPKRPQRMSQLFINEPLCEVKQQRQLRQAS